MLVKLDIAKAYDKLNWQFIRKMLEAFGFNRNFVNWVMNLVSSAFFSILVNGVPSRIIKPSRALDKGIYEEHLESPWYVCLFSWLKSWGDLFRPSERAIP